MSNQQQRTENRQVTSATGRLTGTEMAMASGKLQVQSHSCYSRHHNLYVSTSQGWYLLASLNTAASSKTHAARHRCTLYTYSYSLSSP
jgi:hypothetical protein